MSRNRATRTKDERFLITLYEMALETGETDAPFPRYEVGVRAVLNPKGVDTICKLLIQANFIRKKEEDEVYLTPHGVKLAQQLSEE